MAADNEFEKKANELWKNGLKDELEFYKVPLKSGKAYHYMLKPYDKVMYLKNLRNLYSTVSGKPRQYIDNTIEFIEKTMTESK